MLENNSYEQCLLIYFYITFDVVKHSVLLSKLRVLYIPPSILNWITAFLTDRNHVCETAYRHFSAVHSSL